MKVNPWKNRREFLFLLSYYYKKLKPATREILRLREAGEFALEKKKLGEVYYALCRDAVEYEGIEIEVRGRENLPSENETACFIANHQGYADVVALGYALGGLQISFIAKQDLEKVPLYGRFIQDIRGLYLPTHDSVRAHVEVINAGIRQLKEGFNMAIFPEGSRSWGPEMLAGGFKKGSIQMAARAGVPVIPVVLEGSYHIFEEQKAIRPGKIIVSILPPVPTAGIPKPEWNGLSDQVEEAIRTELELIHRELSL